MNNKYRYPIPKRTPFSGETRNTKADIYFLLALIVIWFLHFFLGAWNRLY